MADWVDAARHLQVKIDQEIEDISAHIANGVSDWSTYLHYVGKINGMRTAREFVDRLLKNVDYDD